MKQIQIILLVLVFAFISSCQKVIHVNLNAAAPQFVIEANIEDSIPNYQVVITKTVSFEQDNVFPAVSGALVLITDSNNNHTDTLKEISTGIYQVTVSKLPSPGITYQLYINAGGSVFTATSIMPQKVYLDSISVQKSPFRGNLQFVPVYQDPIAKGNSYHFIEYVNGVAGDGIYVRNDNLVNGQVATQPLGGGGVKSGSGPNGSIASGDLVQISLECIDANVYEYYFTLSQVTNQNSATPSNPKTNINGGALGYFSAHTSSTKSIIVP